MHSVSFYIDNNEVKTHTFDRFINHDGRLVLSAGTDFSDVFAKERFYNGGSYKNISGMHTFSVKARDRNGNETFKSVTVTIR